MECVIHYIVYHLEYMLGNSTQSSTTFKPQIPVYHALQVDPIPEAAAQAAIEEMEQSGFYEEYDEDEDSGDDEYAALEGALLGEGMGESILRPHHAMLYDRMLYTNRWC